MSLEHIEEMRNRCIDLAIKITNDLEEKKYAYADRCIDLAIKITNDLEEKKYAYAEVFGALQIATCISARSHNFTKEDLMIMISQCYDMLEYLDKLEPEKEG